MLEYSNISERFRYARVQEYFRETPRAMLEYSNTLMLEYSNISEKIPMLEYSSISEKFHYARVHYAC